MELYSILATLSLTIFVTFPGIVFRRIYFQHEFSKQFSTTNWNASLTFSAFFGVIVTIITFKFFENFSYFSNSLNKLSYIKDSVIAGNFSEIIKIKYLSTITWYLTISVLIAVALGHLIYKIVRVTNFDKIITFLRFENHWHYYFTGESLDFSSFKSLREHKYSPDSTLAEIIITTPEGSLITYRGQLQQHTISKKHGSLELIYLIYPARLISQNNYESIEDCDILMLPYKNIVDIKLNYYYEPNINRQEVLRIFKILLWLFYSINFVLFLINIFKHNLKFSIVIVLVYHLIFYSLYTIFSSGYEAFCVRKENKINQKNSNNLQELYTKVFAYIILFLLLFFLTYMLYKFGK